MESSIAWSFAIVIVSTSALWLAALALGAWAFARVQSVHRAEMECQHTNHRRLLEAAIVGFRDPDGQRALALSMEHTAQQELKADVEKNRPDPNRSPFTGASLSHAQ